MRDLLHDTADRAANYLDTLQTRRISPDPDAVQALDQLRQPLPETPSDPAETLRILDELGSPATMLMSSRRFFGLVIGSKLPAALVAKWLATAWDNNTAYFRTSPAPVMFENECCTGLAGRCPRLTGRYQWCVRHRCDDGESDRDCHLPLVGMSC